MPAISRTPERLARIAMIAFIRGTATALGSAVIGVAVWWLTGR
ncbi:hypothetical protein ACIBI3_08530 [Actinomadura luteofluorescens]